jgi:C2 domain.
MELVNYYYYYYHNNVVLLQFRLEDRQDSYVRVTLNQHYRTVKIKRTSTVKGTDSPNFSECFNFRVPSAQIDVTSVGFQVLQAVSGYGRGKYNYQCLMHQ